MDKLFSGVSTPEGLIGTALTLAFIWIMYQSVKQMKMGGSEGDPVVSALGKLSGAIKTNTDLCQKQLDEFRSNNSLFVGLGLKLDQINDTLKEIERNTRK